MFADEEYQNTEDSFQSANNDCPKCKNCTLEELAILKEIAVNPYVTQIELAAKIGVSVRTIKSRTVDMQTKGLIVRENGRRNGKWIII